MDYQGLRNASRRLVIELAVVVVLAGLPIDFPRATSTGRAWSYILSHPSLLLHVVVGTLILAESSTLLIRSVRRATRRLWTPAAIGLPFVALAYGSGLAYAGTGQHDSALTTMTWGWLGATGTYAIGWYLGHRALAAQRRATAAN